MLQSMGSQAVGHTLATEQQKRGISNLSLHVLIYTVVTVSFISKGFDHSTNTKRTLFFNTVMGVGTPDRHIYCLLEA